MVSFLHAVFEWLIGSTVLVGHWGCRGNAQTFHDTRYIRSDQYRRSHEPKDTSFPYVQTSKLQRVVISNRHDTTEVPFVSNLTRLTITGTRTYCVYLRFHQSSYSSLGLWVSLEHFSGWLANLYRNGIAFKMQPCLVISCVILHTE